MTQLFHNVKALLVDLSGTLHIDNYAITGSQAALKKIRNHGYKLKFVTNTSKENVECLHTRLQNLNFEIFREEIYSSLTACKQLLYSRGLRPHLMLSDSAKQDFIGLNTENPNAVLVGLSPHHFQYDEMTLAFRMLLDGAALIAINKARFASFFCLFTTSIWIKSTISTLTLECKFRILVNGGLTGWYETR